MPSQPCFANPVEVFTFIRTCLEQDDPQRLYAAFEEETSSLWQERIFHDLGAIDQAETLEHVFLESGRITQFPADESILHLGGHGPQTRYLHIKIGETPEGWRLVSIHVCR